MSTERQEILETRAMNPIEPSKEELDNIIKHHVWGSMGIGLIPVPLVDFVALTGIQIHMLRRVAELYNLPFSRDRAKNIVASLLGSFTSTAAAPSITISLTKIIPILGQAFGVITMPVLSGAATYAVGKVFVRHFASGGTFLTFDHKKVQEYYMEMFREGERLAAAMKDSKQPVAETQAEEKPVTQAQTEKKPVTEVKKDTTEKAAAKAASKSVPGEDAPVDTPEEPPKDSAAAKVAPKSVSGENAPADTPEEPPKDSAEKSAENDTGTPPKKRRSGRSRKKSVETSEN